MHFKFKIKNSSKGITLVELVVVVFLIVTFSMILISDFPKIQRQFALSRVAYKLAQDLRMTEDLGLSGVPLSDINGQSIATKGYGIYIPNVPTTQYVVYADVADVTGNSDSKYSGDTSYPLCSEVNQVTNGTLRSDCVIEIINIRNENSSLSIQSINNTSGISASINFSPPNPTTTITAPGFSGSTIGIVLSNDLTNRTLQVNTSGLINISQ